ncbi:unnamed protein product [Brassica napus]|uniref:(rape) hypothetical protein n=1 Tax=Brassica napus TaxID=3708 RepID=A0A816XD19_BRANA|nr:unnamed protein product [Brassica napus]
MSRGDYVTLKAQQTQALGYVKVSLAKHETSALCGDRCCSSTFKEAGFKKPSRVVILDDVALVSRLIMERPGQKVLYEIRHHASFPYDPRYPPLPQRCLKTEDKVNQAFAEHVADGSSWLTNTFCRT